MTAPKEGSHVPNPRNTEGISSLDGFLTVEIALADAAQRAITQATLQRRTPDTAAQRFDALRDEIAEVNADDVAALVTQMEQLQLHAQASSAGPLPDVRVPYFAHMRLRTGRRVRDILLGYHTFIDARTGVRIVDWRKAPIAGVFFRYRQGEEYQVELPAGLQEGVVELRAVVAFQDGALARVDGPSNTWVRGDQGWEEGTQQSQPILSGALGGTRARQLVQGTATGRTMPVVTALLDPEQFAAMEAEAEGPLLLLGAAGCGKTTVALHRLALLRGRDPKRFRSEAMVVVVPTEGLLRLTRLLLDELQMPDVKVLTFDGWVRTYARRAFKRLPKRECEDPPSRVVRFKRHPAMLEAIVSLAHAQGLAVAEKLDRRLRAEGQIVRLFEESQGRSLAARFDKVCRRFVKPYGRADQDAIRRVFRREQKDFDRANDDRLALLGDKAFLMQAVACSAGELTEGDADEVIRHTRLQFAEPERERYAGVDAERLQALDGRALDDGTPDENIGTIDVEDYALLIDLQRRKHGRLRGTSRYAHVVIDEAQELAAIELAALGGALTGDAAVTVAGDAAQQLDPTTCFSSWRGVLASLGVEDTQPVCLETNYRCTRPIAEFAHAVLGTQAPAKMPRAVRDGIPVQRSLTQNLAHAAIEVAETLSRLQEREPLANVAIITHSEENAEFFHELLEQGLDVHLVRDGDFGFGPGIEIADVAQVKGLEFDYVVIPDVSPGDYGVDDASRRALHVAATRAIHQLWVIAVGREPGLLP